MQDIGSFNLERRYFMLYVWLLYVVYMLTCVVIMQWLFGAYIDI